MTAGTFRAAVPGAILIGVVASACDPCDGVIGCESGADVSAGGTLIEFVSGDPVPGVALDFLHRGGVEVASDSVRVVTDDDGRFRFEVGAAEEAEALFEVRVDPPGAERYSVELPLMASTVRGEGRELGRWVVNPFLGFSGQVVPAYRWEPECREPMLSQLRARFRRTGGIPIEPDPAQGVIEGGRVVFLAHPLAVGNAGGTFGPVEGMATIYHEVGGTVLTEWSLVTNVWYEDAPPGGGPVTLPLSLNYAGEAYRRSGAEKLPLYPGEIEFVRTGGIDVCPERFVRELQPWGGFSLSMATVSEGEVVGDLIIRSEEGLTDTIRDLHVPTFRGGDFRLLGRWGLGHHINYVATFYFTDTGNPIAGVEVEFRRTGGIRIEPERFTHTTTDWGGIPIQPHTNEEGTVLGEFHVRLPEGTVVIRDVGIPTFDADGLRLLGTFAVTRPTP